VSHKILSPTLLISPRITLLLVLFQVGGNLTGRDGGLPMPYFCSKTVMMIFLNIFLLSLAVLWTLPSLILLLECLSAVFLKKTGVSPLEASPQTSFQILIPAHNEAAGIKTTLESLIPQVEHP